MPEKVSPSSAPRARRRFRLSLTFAAGLLVIAAAIGALQFLPLPGDDESVGAGTDDSPETSETSESGATETGDNQEPQDLYVEADVGFPGTLNPLLADSRSEESIAALLYRGLTRIDTNGDPVPDLADSWSVSDDGLTYTVDLNPDATWHDGEPVTVDDVLFTISLIQEPDFPGAQSRSRFWRAITVQQVDELTMSFELLEPYSGFLHYLTLPILPKHEFGGILAADLSDPVLGWGEIGNGSYTLDSVDEEAGEIHLVARDTGESGPDLESVVFRYYESLDEAIEAFQSGSTDGLSYVPQYALHDGSLPSDSRVYASSLSGYTGLYFNVRRPKLRDAETRRALEAAIDREAIVSSVLNGQAVVGSSPIPQMLSAHQPGDHAGHDPERAAELLEQAGWQPDESGVLYRDGERFTIPLLVNGDDEQRVAVATEIKRQLGNVGISVEVQARSSDEVQRLLDARQFGAALFGWHTRNGDPDCFQLWHSSQAEEGMNFTGFADSDADEHLVNARHALSVDERNQHYAEFQKIFAEQVPAVVVFYPRYHFAVSANIVGAEPRPLVNPGDHVRQIPEWSFGDPAREQSHASGAQIAGAVGTR